METTLKAIRTKHKRGQHDEATALGISVNHYCSIENGRSMPSRTLEKKMVELYHRSLESLLRPFEIIIPD